MSAGVFRVNRSTSRPVNGSTPRITSPEPEASAYGSVSRKSRSPAVTCEDAVPAVPASETWAVVSVVIGFLIHVT